MSQKPEEPVPALRPHEIGSLSYRNKLGKRKPKPGSIESEGPQEPTVSETEGSRGQQDSKKS